MYQDLHTHTKLSDGVMTYREVLDLAAKNNVGVVAFTDHDLVSGRKELKELEKLCGHKTRWIVGVELTSGPPQELEGIEIPQFHIVGLFVDPRDQDLVRYGRAIIEEEIEKTKKMVKNLNLLGFKLTAEDCFKEAQGQTIQRPHIVTALLKNEVNIKIVKEFIEKIKKDALKNKSLKRKYEVILKNAKAEPENPFRQAIYELFLTPVSYARGIYVGSKNKADFDKSVALIRNAGGIAILAHWSESKSAFPIEIVEKIFKEGRIDGAEIAYDLYRIDFGEETALRYEQAKIKKLVEKYHLLASAGSDCHHPETMERFFKIDWLAKPTVGLVERMLESKKDIYRGWSTVQI